MTKYTIVGIYELSIEANSFEEAITKMQNLKIKECVTYISDYDYEE